MRPIQIFVGLDPQAEPVAYHVFCQSVTEHASVPVSFTPLSLSLLKGIGYEQDGNRDGSNGFIYSRFLVPYLCDYKGKALFFDGDMLCRADVKELIDLCDERKAVHVVKHDYTTKHQVKYLGARNEDYPRKNWSSVILWNCNHWQCKHLTPKAVMEKPGSYLHRLEWIDDERFIGELPPEWNWLVSEQEYNAEAKLVHHTIGTPCFDGWYQTQDYAEEWWNTYRRMIFPLTGEGKQSQL